MAKLTTAKRNSLPLRSLQAPTAILALQAAPNQNLDTTGAGYGYYGGSKGGHESRRILSRQSRNQRRDSIVPRCQSCREPDDGVAHGTL
jgi:hypothetical protein